MFDWHSLNTHSDLALLAVARTCLVRAMLKLVWNFLRRSMYATDTADGPALVWSHLMEEIQPLNKF